MFTSIWEDVKREFDAGNMVTRLIMANVAAFVFVTIVWIMMRIFGGWDDQLIYKYYDPFIQFFEMSSSWWHNLTHPWVIFTHMFLHTGFWHILWNMLFLYWFGRIVGDFIGNQRVLPLYLLGGLVGGITYFITYNLLPYGGGMSYALGASAAVNAFVVAAATISPDFTMRLFLLGDVKLKYIAAALIFIDLVGMAGNINTGGHFAHLGGAFFGWLYVHQLREGNDMSLPVNQILNRISNFFMDLKNKMKGDERPRPKVVYKNKEKTRQTNYNTRSNRSGNTASDNGTHQEQLDAILDKIKKSGYDSLSQAEKEFLFNASKD